MSIAIEDHHVFLGRPVLGDTLPLLLLCTDGNGVATVPDKPPVVRIYTGAGALVTSQRMPAARDKFNRPGLFSYELLLGTSYATGHYSVLYHYLLSSAPYAKSARFEIAAGGGTSGPVLSLTYYPRPAANFLVYRTADNTRRSARNMTL